MARGYQWVRMLTPDRKAEVTAACERIVADLKQKHLREIRPASGCNYPVDIRGRWRGENYTFVVRFRSGFPENEGEEYEVPFARVDHFNGRFAVQWMRHTGRWWCLRSELTLQEALHMLETEPVLRPPV